MLCVVCGLWCVASRWLGVLRCVFVVDCCLLLFVHCCLMFVCCLSSVVCGLCCALCVV